MPCVVKEYDLSVGPLIEIQIQSHDSGFKSYKGLIDTGASITCISNKVVNDLNLKCRGQIPTTTPAGTKALREFTVYLSFPSISLQIKQSTISRVFPMLTVIEHNMKNQSYNILIGRDIISKGIFSIGLNNSFTICF